MTLSALHASRVLMGDSLGFHIIFVMFGLTLPVLVSWFEWLGIHRRDQKLINLAHFWSKIMALLVITGVISGTIIALQMSLVWPGILKFGGEVIGLPFMYETYAFLIEATFLALYMMTWHSKRVTPLLHWAMGLMVVVGATLSAYTITSVNGWMNLPTGFTIVQGKFANVDVIAAMFSRTAIVEFVHSMPGYYLTATLIVAGMYAFRLARVGAKDRTKAKYSLDWYILQRLMWFAGLAFLLSGITADVTGKYLAKYEPQKLAAIELNYKTQSNAPLLIGGFAGADGQVTGPYIAIPGALSLLSANSASFEVQGVDSFPVQNRPSLAVHTLFVVKMTLITALAGLLLAYVALLVWRRPWLKSRPALILIGISGFLAVAVVELGWMMTEIGRQPWAVRGYVTTSEALSKTHDISTFGYVFPAAYAILFVVTIWGVHKLIRDEQLSGTGRRS